jgi:hypothetical protein
MKRKAHDEHVSLESLEARLKEWGIDFEKFRATAGKTAGETKVSVDKDLAQLRAQFKDAQTKLGEFKESSDAAFVEFRKTLGKAYAKLRKGLR